jgi:lipoprotein-releasing system permease protein
MGARDRAVFGIYSGAGLIIGAVGTAAGLGLGLTLSALLARLDYRLDPKVYLISRLPVEINALDLALAVVLTLAICLIATVYPSLRAARLRPVEGLRYE